MTSFGTIRRAPRRRRIGPRARSWPCRGRPRPSKAARSRVGTPWPKPPSPSARSPRPEEALQLTRCTGVLIAPDLVLTAAHCVNGDPLGALVVFFRGTEPARPVYGARVAARYSPDPGEMLPNAAPDVSLADLSLDLAVLRLTEPVRGRRPVAAGRRSAPASRRACGSPGPACPAACVGRLRTATLTPLAASSTGLTIAQTEGRPGLLRRFRWPGRRAGSRRHLRLGCRQRGDQPGRALRQLRGDRARRPGLLGRRR